MARLVPFDPDAQKRPQSRKVSRLEKSMLNAQSSPNIAPIKRRVEKEESPQRPQKKRKHLNGLNTGLDTNLKAEIKSEHLQNGSGGASSSRKIDPEIAKSQEQLPIWPGKDAIVEAVRKNGSVVIIGEPGSGKTTQVPQFLLDAGIIAASGIIAITQPRKVAATTIARRVANERGVKVGDEVGYAVRFDDSSSSSTRIKFYTDGMLLREMLNDPHLSKCDVVIVDEAHERTVRTDVLLANLIRLQKERNGHGPPSSKGKETAARRPLKIIVMSASLQAERFSKYLAGAPILYVKGRQHPVKIYYTKEAQEDYLDSALRTFFQIHDEKESGDVLIFLPGQENIESLASTIRLYAKQRQSEGLKILVRPLYAALALQQQFRAFDPAPPNTRKCVIATNIAETSVTIPGIKFVIDCGLCNEKRYLAQSKGSGIERLSEVEISRSSAVQRAGRAGREGPGKCFRLYTEEAYKKLLPAPLPEIKRCDLKFAMLQQKSFGQDLENINFMDPPDRAAVISAHHTLVLLGALDQKSAITPTGRAMAKLPLEPSHARALIESQNQGCVKEMINIVSLLSASAVVFLDFSTSEEREAALAARSKFFHRSGDHMTLLNVFRAFDDIGTNNGGDDTSDDEGQAPLGKMDRKSWCKKQHINDRALIEAVKIRGQLQKSCIGAGMDINLSSGDDSEPVLRSLCRGLFHNTAIKRADGSYKSANMVIKVHPASVLSDKKPSAIMYEELVLTTFPYARYVSTIAPSWLMENSSSLQQTSK